MGAGQSGRGEEGAAGAALAAVKTGARTSPGAGDRSGWDSAAATALERLPGIAIGLLVGLPVTEPFSACLQPQAQLRTPNGHLSEIRTPNEHPQRPAQLIVLRQRPGHVAELGDCPKNHFANWEIAPNHFCVTEDND